MRRDASRVEHGRQKQQDHLKVLLTDVAPRVRVLRPRGEDVTDVPPSPASDPPPSAPPSYPPPTTTYPPPGPSLDTTGPPWYRKPVPLWSLIATAGVAVFIIVVVAIASSDNSELDKTKQDLAAVQADASSQSSAASAASADASQASSSASNAVAQAQSSLAASQSAVTASQSAVDASNASLASAKAEFDAAVAGRKATQFGDGTFQVGRDIQPGTYHTEGGSSCYWEKNTGLDDIIDNDNASGPVTLIIDSPYFKSEDCGTWTLVG
jgi:hypothetical protein